ncbi:class I SAM-dependent methyltransferase [Tardiphaga sp.]|uniref:class I SAM-dependent methyltransferase n=1 Tax=Tardiphaga sp. TaxID=1926292 RepID=UPI00261D3A7A|nr:class I SAM-dependent methyltransferase [Tardiphaga sp.]MDB5618146.1 Methyltransferase type 12 [Tardiphaga sp.]
MTITSDFDDADAPLWQTEATGHMNRMYRWQRYIYDATRRYYLLGRDQLIDGIRPAASATVLEIGCGTGRNLVHAARKYPNTTFYGIDVSTEMLTTAISAIERGHLVGSVRVAHGDATAFDPAALFGIAAFDHVMISYSLSMIPDWHAVLDNAVLRLKPAGQLHIVDFGHQERLPRMARVVLLRWLALFDVMPRRSLQDALKAIAANTGASLSFERPFRGYAQSAVLILPKRPD